MVNKFIMSMVTEPRCRSSEYKLRSRLPQHMTVFTQSENPEKFKSINARGARLKLIIFKLGSSSVTRHTGSPPVLQSSASHKLHLLMSPCHQSPWWSFRGIIGSRFIARAARLLVLITDPGRPKCICVLILHDLESGYLYYF